MILLADHLQAQAYGVARWPAPRLRPGESLSQ